MNNEIAAEPLAVRIRRLRMAGGLTQRQLGNESVLAVLPWADGRRVNTFPRGGTWKLAGALGIDVAALLGETPNNIDDLAEEVQLIAAFRMLPKERKLIAIKLLEALTLTGN